MSKTITVGDRVKIVTLPPYLKTAEPMPMLRPADLLEIGDEGVVIDRRPGGYWGVRFPRGAFLIEPQYVELVLDHSIEKEATENN
ncbi:MAG: regulatory protein SipA [Prochloraceae cyanobacterium]